MSVAICGQDRGTLQQAMRGSASCRRQMCESHRMSARMLPVLHIICANDRAGDPRLHAFIDRLNGSGWRVEAIVEDPLPHGDMGAWAAAVRSRLVDAGGASQRLHLLGYCSGGDIALQVLHGLEADGVGVGYIGFIDTRQSSPAVRLRHGDYGRHGMGRSRRIREQLGRLAPPESAAIVPLLGSWATAIVSGPPRQFGRRFRHRHRYGLLGRGRRSDRRWWAAHLAHDWCYPSITAPVHLYGTEVSIQRSEGDPSQGMSRFLLGGFTVRRIEGDHLSCIQPPHLDGLVEMIERDRAAAFAVESADGARP